MTNEYIAGFFDGEGSVLVYKRTTSLSPKSSTTPYQIRATITNTNEAVIRAIQAKHGGSIYNYPPAPRRRPAWKWTVLCQDAAKFLTAIAPYLIIKAPEVEIALKLQARIDQSRLRRHPGRKGQPPLSPEEIAMRDALWLALQKHRRTPY